MDVDHRHTDRQAVAHLLVGAHRRDAVANDADIEAGAAHVARDDVAIARGERGVRGRLHPGRRPRHQRVDGVAGGDVDRHGAAIALHDEQVARGALAPKLAGERSQVPIDHRLEVPVDGRRGAALVFAILRQQLGADGDVRVRPHGRRDLARALLVPVVDVRMNEVDDERFRAGSAQHLGGAPHRILVERDDDLPLGIDALRHLETEITRDERLERPLETVRRRARAATQLEHIAKAARGDEPRHRALALEQRVRRGRGAVDQHLDRRGRDAGLAQRREHAVGLIADGGRDLGDSHGTRRFVHQDQVGEGAAHVDADQIRCGHDSRYLLSCWWMAGDGNLCRDVAGVKRGRHLPFASGPNTRSM